MKKEIEYTCSACGSKIIKTIHYFPCHFDHHKHRDEDVANRCKAKDSPDRQLSRFIRDEAVRNDQRLRREQMAKSYLKGVLIKDIALVSDISVSRAGELVCHGLTSLMKRHKLMRTNIPIRKVSDAKEILMDFFFNKYIPSKFPLPEEIKLP